jgi:hypothetical protein
MHITITSLPPAAGAVARSLLATPAGGTAFYFKATPKNVWTPHRGSGPGQAVRTRSPACENGARDDLWSIGQKTTQTQTSDIEPSTAQLTLKKGDTRNVYFHFSRGPYMPIPVKWLAKNFSHFPSYWDLPTAPRKHACWECSSLTI